MLESDDGLVWKKRAYFQETAGDETAFLFEDDGSVLAVGRNGGGGNAQLLRSKPPYTDWVRKDLDRSDRRAADCEVGRRTFSSADARRRRKADRRLRSAGSSATSCRSSPSCRAAATIRIRASSSSRRIARLVSYYSSHERDDAGKPITAIYLTELTLNP